MIAETAQTLADIIDTRRALRLEFIAVLIAFEIVVTFYQIYMGQRGHSRFRSVASPVRST